jgi:predicted DNA-binding transcriptional regulator AlpA
MKCQTELLATLERLAATMESGAPLLLSADAACALLSVSKSTFLRLVGLNKLPGPVNLTDGLALWRRRDLESYIANLKRRTTTPRASKRVASD